ncbi:MAG TPA: hypothetical protein VLU25_07560 [Acidobacteriota bacterium]|nr:hypothetical protein [Acidobacteriota bacterium]
MAAKSKSNRPDPIVQQPPQDQEWLGMVDIVRFLQRRIGLIAGGAVGVAVLALVVIMLLPRQFEASLTLVVSPPTFSSELSPPTFSIQGYKALVESGAVLEETTARLVSRGVLGPDRILRLDDGLSTHVFLSARSDQTPLAPMLRLSARTEDAETSAQVANAWAEVFLEHTRRLSLASLDPTVEIVEGQFHDSRKSLDELEKERLRLLNEFQERLDQTAKAWDDRIAEFRAKSENLIAEFRNQTRRIFSDVGSRYGIGSDSSKSPQSDGVEDQETALRLLAQLLVLRQKLAQTPMVFRLRKTVSDDVLWQALSGAWGEETENRLFSKNLVDEEVNPIHTDLAMRIVQLESQVRMLRETQQNVYWEFDRTVEKLQRERSVALGILQEEREIDLAGLIRDRRRALDRIRREHLSELAPMEREIDRLKSQVQKLSGTYNEVRLAQAREDVPDVRLAMPAVPPRSPKPLGLGLKLLVAVLLGGMLGLAVAIVREINGQSE